MLIKSLFIAPYYSPLAHEIGYFVRSLMLRPPSFQFSILTSLRSRAWFNFSLFILIACILSSCKPNGVPAGGEESVDSLVHISKAQFDNMKMTTGSLQQQAFNVEVKARGIADVPPMGRAKISPAVSGSVKDIFVQLGDRVQKGQALLSLEGPEIIALQQQYLEISGQMKALRAEYERQQALRAEQIASEKVFLEAESNYLKATATCEGLKQQLLLLHLDINKITQGHITSLATLRAPVSGDITRIEADINMVALPGDVVAEIIDTRQLQLNLAVFEKDILSVKPGQKVMFTLPENSGKMFTATVKLAGKAIDSANRTATILAVPSDSARQKLLAGMYIDATIIVSSRTVWALPTDALMTGENNHFVLLLEKSETDGYAFRKFPVHTDKRQGELTEVMPSDEVSPQAVLLVKGVYDAAN